MDPTTGQWHPAGSPFDADLPHVPCRNARETQMISKGGNARCLLGGEASTAKARQIQPTRHAARSMMLVDGCSDPPGYQEGLLGRPCDRLLQPLVPWKPQGAYTRADHTVFDIINRGRGTRTSQASQSAEGIKTALVQAELPAATEAPGPLI